MATHLQIQVTQPDDCKSFYFKDITPAYNVLTDPNGYDTTGVNGIDPNNIDDTQILLDITLPSGTEVNLTIDAANFDPATIPGVVQYQVTLAAVNSAASLALTDFEDGVYKFVYTITDSSDNKVYSVTCYYAKTCTICCELDKRLIDITICRNCDKSRDINTLWEAYMLEKKYNHLVACHDFDGADEVLQYLNDLLDIEHCDSCN